MHCQCAGATEVLLDNIKIFYPSSGETTSQMFAAVCHGESFAVSQSGGLRSLFLCLLVTRWLSVPADQICRYGAEKLEARNDNRSTKKGSRQVGKLSVRVFVPQHVRAQIGALAAPVFRTQQRHQRPTHAGHPTSKPHTSVTAAADHTRPSLPAA